MSKVGIVWDQFGPYHLARIDALRRHLGERLLPVQLSNKTKTYQWTEREGQGGTVTLIQESAVEEISPAVVFFRFSLLLHQRDLRWVLLPSYWPSRSLVLLLAAKLLGCHVVMMNESHAGTATARGWQHGLKVLLLRLFNAGLVGGRPHMAYFKSLGMDERRLFAGYDAIDNDYFQKQADAIRADAEQGKGRAALPKRYILSLGRFVAKKNLPVLIKAYAQLVEHSSEDCPALVFVGSGAEEHLLQRQCHELGLNVNCMETVDMTEGTGMPLEKTKGEVYFYGFRQIEENTRFYSLADCFVLPSLFEEWGLVVNEAMACGIPVIVSNTVGSAPDLIAEGVNGYTFSPLDVAGLVKCLERIISDEELRSKMGGHSRKIIARWGSDFFGVQAMKALNLTSIESAPAI